MLQKISPVHPGIVLLEDYLKPLGISRNEMARAMRVRVNRISEICKGTRSYRRYRYSFINSYRIYSRILDELTSPVRLGYGSR